MKICSKNECECYNFFKIIDDEKEYLLEEFAKNNEGKILIEEIKKYKIQYKDKRDTYENFLEEEKKFSKSLSVSNIYYEKLCKIEPYAFIKCPDYYRSIKFFDRTEKCLQTARYYLMRSNGILYDDNIVYWESGYPFIYLIRSFDLSTAILWYNNTFDYILQIFYFAFGLYKLIENYNENWDMMKIIKKCNYNVLNNICKKNDKENAKINSLLEIIKDCNEKISIVRNWANYLKHKGGIKFKGLYIDDPYKIKKTNENGDVIDETGEFYIEELDIDETINYLQSVHINICETLEKMYSIIEYGK